MPSQASTQTVNGTEGQVLGRTPLSIVVTDAVKRWYMDTNKEAVKGDVVSVNCGSALSPVKPGTHETNCGDTVYNLHMHLHGVAEATSTAWANAH